MSLNKFTDVKTGTDLKLKIGCETLECGETLARNKLEYLTGDLNLVNLTTPDRGTVADTLHTDGLGSCYWGVTAIGSYQYQKTIEQLADFPLPIAGVINLAPNTAYIITTNIDIGANRFDCSGGSVAIVGNSSEISLVSSNAAGAMVTGDDTLVLRWISFTSTVGPVFALDAAAPASGNPDPALDWFGVNLINCADCGTVANYSNFVGFSMAILNSSNLTFDGTFGTVAFDTCIFTTPTGSSLIIPATCTITRRFRIQFSAFVATGANHAISVDAGATINDEQYILFRNNFSGGATNFLDGVQSSDNKASHLNNFGIENSRTIGHYYITVPTPTDTSGSNYTKILGTTTSGTLAQRFTQSISNRAVYNGSETAIFKITTNLSITDGNNKLYSTRIAINGVTLPETTSSFTSSGNGEASNISSQAVVSMDPDDYAEIYIANLTDDTDPTAVTMSVILIRIDT